MKYMENYCPNCDPSGGQQRPRLGGVQWKKLLHSREGSYMEAKEVALAPKPAESQEIKLLSSVSKKGSYRSLKNQKRQ